MPRKYSQSRPWGLCLRDTFQQVQHHEEPYSRQWPCKRRKCGRMAYAWLHGQRASSVAVLVESGCWVLRHVPCWVVSGFKICSNLHQENHVEASNPEAILGLKRHTVIVCHRHIIIYNMLKNDGTLILGILKRRSYSPLSEDLPVHPIRASGNLLFRQPSGRRRKQGRPCQLLHLWLWNNAAWANQSQAPAKQLCFLKATKLGLKRDKTQDRWMIGEDIPVIGGLHPKLLLLWLSSCVHGVSHPMLRSSRTLTPFTHSHSIFLSNSIHSLPPLLGFLLVTVHQSASIIAWIPLMLFGISLLHGFFLVKAANIIINHLTFLAWLVAEIHMLFLLSVSTLLFMGLRADSPQIACLNSKLCVIVFPMRIATRLPLLQLLRI